MLFDLFHAFLHDRLLVLLLSFFQHCLFNFFLSFHHYFQFLLPLKVLESVRIDIRHCLHIFLRNFLQFRAHWVPLTNKYCTSCYLNTNLNLVRKAKRSDWIKGIAILTWSSTTFIRSISVLVLRSRWEGPCLPCLIKFGTYLKWKRWN